MVEPGSEHGRSSVDVGQMLIELLAPRIGKFTARKALEFVADRIGRSTGALGAADLEPVEGALRPMLRTLLGGPTAERVLLELRTNVEQGAQA